MGWEPDIDDGDIVFGPCLFWVIVALVAVVLLAAAVIGGGL